MGIFFFIIVSIVYFVYRWYSAVQKINFIIANTSYGSTPEGTTVIAPAGIGQPCVVDNGTDQDSGQPLCDTTIGLTCVTGLFVGNGDNSNTGVCLSNIGSPCDTLYDCIPFAQGCISGVCENLTESINLPCTYDSDCIGDAVCATCVTGSGVCKDTNGNCSDLVDGVCPYPSTLCDGQQTGYEGTFPYNHICDKSLDVPVCKYDISPKDQGCTLDSDCSQLEGEVFCYTGAFKTEQNPDGALSPPTYGIKSILNSQTIQDAVFQLDFGQSLIDINSFQLGTMVNIVGAKVDTSRNTLAFGPYYIKSRLGTEYVILSPDNLQPDIAAYAEYPNKFIKLNEAEYIQETTLLKSDLYLDIKNDPSKYEMSFGILPPTNITTSCFYTTQGFKIVDNDSSFLIRNNVNVQLSHTKVRFNINIQGQFTSFGKSPIFTLDKISPDGTVFNVTPRATDLEKYNSEKSLISVLFGDVIQGDTLNDNKGVCLPKLPVTANIVTDSKYNLSNYTFNPCVEIYDGGISVVESEGFCKLSSTLTGPGSACRFAQDDVNNLPCSKDTGTFKGFNYDLTCLIDDTLTESIRNNANFLNSSYSGICAYPVNDKYKPCDKYNDNCMTPYVCTEYQGANFCDSRFDVFQCNSSYVCPDGYVCQDGYCQNSVVDGIASYCAGASGSPDICISPYECQKSVYLSVYNSTEDSDYDKSNKFVEIELVNFTASNLVPYTLLVKSVYLPNLTTYAFVYSDDNTYYLYEISDPLGTPTLQKLHIKTSTEYKSFILNYSKKIEVWGYNISGRTLTLQDINNGDPFSFKLPTQVVDTILGIDINDDNLIITSRTTVNGTFVNLDIADKTKRTQTFKYQVHFINNFKTDKNNIKTFTLPFNPSLLNGLQNCRFDLLEVTNDELDIVCVQQIEDMGNPIIGVRYKPVDFDTYNNSYFDTAQNCNGATNNDPDLGCFINPTITSIKEVSDVDGISETDNVYLVTSQEDINTLYSFSAYDINLDGVQIIKYYKKSTSLYICTASPIHYLDNHVVSITPDEYMPFSLTDKSAIDNYGNFASNYLEYPYWVTALQDLVVGDNYTPKVAKVFYEPNRVNKNYYMIADMFTGFRNPETEAIAGDQSLKNMYLFKFSSDNNETGLTINETIPVKINGHNDFTRFSMCNETQNMYFLTHKCGSM